MPKVLLFNQYRLNASQCQIPEHTRTSGPTANYDYFGFNHFYHLVSLQGTFFFLGKQKSHKN
jgi:hypothetical protein